MNIFNSLGSNYNLKFALKTLLVANKPIYTANLIKYLTKKYQGKTALTYKGRQALTLALQALKLPPNSVVAINAFTCFAVYQGITAAGLKVEYLDPAPQSLNFSGHQLLKGLHKNPQIKAVVVQNTLGYPSSIKAISKICQKHKLYLIEDLAHSVGTTYSTGQEAGTVGDATILSFSQDKIIDGISGGAVIIRNKKLQKNLHPAKQKLNQCQQRKDRFYPLLTLIIKKTYPLLIGKVFHQLFKLFQLLSTPMGQTKSHQSQKLPHWYAALIYYQIQKHKQNLAHRKKIALTYASQLNQPAGQENICPYLKITANINNSTNIRFPIFVNNRQQLIKYLKHQKVFVSDIWYDAPIAPKRFLEKTNYSSGSCPVGEHLAATVLNLPTHQNINLRKAKKITSLIAKWQQLQ